MPRSGSDVEAAARSIEQAAVRRSRRLYMAEHGPAHRRETFGFWSSAMRTALRRPTSLRRRRDAPGRDAVLAGRPRPVKPFARAPAGDWVLDGAEAAWALAELLACANPSRPVRRIAGGCLRLGEQRARR